jgi:hypothetical protein
VNFHAGVNAVILKSSDHLEAGAIADMGKPGIAMASKIALKNPAINGAIEERAPRL